MARHAIKSVINLRGENPDAKWYQDEIASCKTSGCTHYDVRLSSKRLPKRKDLLDLLDMMDTAPKPLLIKCGGGADRTGLASALWLLNRGNTVDSALEQLKLFPFLHRPKENQRWIREFVHFFALTHEQLTLRQWLSTHYTEEKLHTFMEGRGNLDYYAKD